MAVGFVQAVISDANGSVTSASKAYSSNNTAGNLLVCGIGQFLNTTPNVATVTDTQGNIWQKATDLVGFGSHYGGLFYVENCKPGANTVTVSNTVSGSAAAQYTAFILAEFSGVATASSIGVTAGGTNSAVTSHTSGNTGAATDGDLVLGFYTDTTNTATITIGTGFATTANGSPGSTTTNVLEHILSATAGVQAATFTSSIAENSIGLCACFHAGVAAGQQPAVSFAFTSN